MVVRLSVAFICSLAVQPTEKNLLFGKLLSYASGMITKTEGISISYIRYKDTSIIARVFTQHHGLQSLVVNGIRSKKSRRNPGYFEPFSVLELVLYWSKQKDIHRLSEFQAKYPLSGIRSDLRKSTITLFLSEILGKVLQSEKQEKYTSI